VSRSAVAVAAIRAELDGDEKAASRLLSTISPRRGEWRLAGMQVRDDAGHLIVKHTWPHEGEHIIRHDPATVLPRVEALRSILDLYEYCRDHQESPYDAARLEVLEDVVTRLAAGYAEAVSDQPNPSLAGR
jgi:hypothetical protein